MMRVPGLPRFPYPVFGMRGHVTPRFVLLAAVGVFLFLGVPAGASDEYEVDRWV